MATSKRLHQNNPGHLASLIVVAFYVGLFSIVIASCTRSSKSRVQSQNHSLTLKGRVLDPNGGVLSQAAIYIGHRETPYSASGADGSFSITLQNISEIENDVRGEGGSVQPSFLLFILQADRKLAATSTPINFSNIGDLDLGALIAKPTSSYQGRVVLSDQNQNLSLSNASQVFLGPFKASTNEVGIFNFDNVPVGTLPLKILTPKNPAGSGFSSQFKMVSITDPPSQAVTNGNIDKMKELEILSPETFVVFHQNGPSGLLIPETLSKVDGSQAINKSVPTRRSFKVYANTQSRFIRYHHDRKVLENLPQTTASKDTTIVVDAPSSWKVIQDTISYDFPSDGGQTIYYQFSDLDKTSASEIYKAELDIDIFMDTTGFKIGDGEKPVLLSSTTLNIDLPKLAVAMRIAPDIRSLSSAPWQKAQTQYKYTFESKSRDVPGSDNSFREVFLQFRDAFGRESKMFRQEANLDIYKDFSFTIGDGSGIVRSRNVEVTFNLSQDISGIRIAETREGLQKAFWQHPEQKLTYALTVRQDQATGFFILGGRRELCIQANSSGNIESPVYCKGFEVELFNQNQGKFVVNDGNRISTSRLVKVNVQIPENTYEMRIFENGPDTSATTDTVVLFPGTGLARSTNAERAWMVPVNETFYVFNTVGSRVLYLQFRTIDGIVSSIYQQSLVILPIAEAYAFTRISLNSGSPVTLFPFIGLTIENVPQTATAMLISVNAPPNPLNLGAWQVVEPYVEIPIAFPGPKTVYVLFRNSDREISPSFQRVIEFQPFPNDSLGMIVNGGGNLTFTPIARVQLTAPPTAYEMRYACEGEEITSKQYLPFQPFFECSLGTTFSNFKRVKVQFRTENRLDESPVLLSQLIQYREAFPPSQIGVRINDGALSTTNSKVQLKIDAPIPPTQFMRISHISTSDLQSMSWVQYYRDVSYDLPSTTGNYTIFVQLSDGGLNESAIFSSNIELK